MFCSRSSLHSAKSDSKLVIYGASGIASPAHSVATTPSHVIEDTPTHQATPSLDIIRETTNPSLSHEQTAGDVVRVGSVADVEHKSVASLINGRRTSSSGGQSSNYDSRRSSHASVTVEQEANRHGNESYHWNREEGEGALNRRLSNTVSAEHVQRKMGSSSPHRSSTEHVQRKPSYGSPYAASTEHVQKRYGSSSPAHGHSREFVIRRTSGDYSRRVVASIEDSARQHSQDRITPLATDHTPYENGNKWYESDDQQNGHRSLSHRLPNNHHALLEEEETPRSSNGPWYQDDTWKHDHHGNRKHHSTSYIHQWNGRSHNTSHDQSPDPPLYNGVYEHKTKASSLPRDVTPERVQEEEEEQGKKKKRVIDPNHPARPKNRGPFRLSLQDSTFYDTTRQHRGGSARWPRHTTITSISTSSLSQPVDLLGVS